MDFNALAINGPPGVGKSTLIGILSQRLRMSSIGAGDLLREEWANYNKSNTISFLQYYSKIVSDKRIEEINQELATRLKQGRVIVDSRFALINARGLPNVATIYLSAPLDVRVSRCASSSRYSGWPLDSIGAELEERENIEISRGKKWYSTIHGGEFNCHNKEGYTLVLDTENLSIEQEAEKIISVRKPNHWFETLFLNKSK